MDILLDEVFEELKLEKKSFAGDDLSRKEFFDCQFVECDFSESDMSHTIFEDCTFTRCNLSLVKLNNARLRGIKFVETKLLGLDFAKCDRFILEFECHKSIIKNCSFREMNIQKTKFAGCDILDCDFIESNLVSSDFSEANLRGTTFLKSNLEKCDFSNAYDYIINPNDNKVKKAVFTLPEAMGLLKGFNIVIK